MGPAVFGAGHQKLDGIRKDNSSNISYDQDEAIFDISAPSGDLVTKASEGVRRNLCTYLEVQAFGTMTVLLDCASKAGGSPNVEMVKFSDINRTFGNAETGARDTGYLVRLSGETLPPTSYSQVERLARHVEKTKIAFELAFTDAMRRGRYYKGHALKVYVHIGHLLFKRRPRAMTNGTRLPLESFVEVMETSDPPVTFLNNM